MKNVDLKQMKRISVIWGLIMFLALAGVTVLGFVYKNETKKYKEFESLLVEQSHEYVLNNNLEKISLNELKEKEVISSVTVNEKELDEVWYFNDRFFDYNRKIKVPYFFQTDSHFFTLGEISRRECALFYRIHHFPV